jgi:hypothetical protein
MHDKLNQHLDRGCPAPFKKPTLIDLGFSDRVYLQLPLLACIFNANLFQ